jgi:hypothetical protein
MDVDVLGEERVGGVQRVEVGKDIGRFCVVGWLRGGVCGRGRRRCWQVEDDGHGALIAFDEDSKGFESVLGDHRADGDVGFLESFSVGSSRAVVVRNDV